MLAGTQCASKQISQSVLAESPVRQSDFFINPSLPVFQEKFIPLPATPLKQKGKTSMLPKSNNFWRAFLVQIGNVFGNDGMDCHFNFVANRITGNFF